MMRPFNAVPHVVLNPNHKIIFLLLHNCNFSIVMHRNVFLKIEICQRGLIPQVVLESFFKQCSLLCNFKKKKNPCSDYTIARSVVISLISFVFCFFVERKNKLCNCVETDIHCKIFFETILKIIKDIII